MNWKEELDEQVIARCGDLSEHQEQIENFISSKIIEKIIDDIPDIEFADYPSGFEATEFIKAQLRKDWL